MAAPKPERSREAATRRERGRRGPIGCGGANDGSLFGARRERGAANGDGGGGASCRCCCGCIVVVLVSLFQAFESHGPVIV